VRVRHQTFRSLRVRNYRRYTAANLLSTTGTWMQLVAQSWLVMQVTGSTTALGASVMLQALPSVVFGMWGGLLADRMSRRALLIGTQALHALLALSVGVLAASGTITLGFLLVVAVLTGLLAAIEGPASAAFGAELVPRPMLPNAVALGAAVSSTGRLVGMGLGGVVASAAAPSTVFFLNGLSYLVVVAALASLRTSEMLPATRSPRAAGQLREGIQHVLSSRRLRITMALAFVLAAFGRNFQVTMAAMTDGPLGTGADGYGLASTVFAAGALGGALLAARLRSLSARVLVVAAAVAATAQAASGLAPEMSSYLLVLVPAALAAVVIDSAISSILQLEAADVVRGRVLSLLSIVSMSGAALGGPLLGGLAEAFGPRASLVGAGTVAGTAAVVGAACFRRVRSASVDVLPARRPPGFEAAGAMAAA
jgi:MFS family permease